MTAPNTVDPHAAHSNSADALYDPWSTAEGLSGETASSAMLPREIGGYRLVRALGSDSRASTALVHAEGVTLVARVFRSSCPSAVIDAEFAVHDAIRGADPALRDHAVAAVDMATLADGRLALLVTHVSGARLDDLLASRRDTLALGEAVTVLAPIAHALEIAHDAGVTGLGLRARALRLTAGGAPVIVRVQDAQAGPALPERFRTSEPSYAADRAAIEQLGAAVAAAVPERDRDGLLVALSAAARGSALAPALFDLAEPVPVRVAAVGDSSLSTAEPGPSDARDASDLSSRGEAERGDRYSVVVSAIGAPSARAIAPDAADGAEARGTRAPTWLVTLLDTLRVLGLPPDVIERVRGAVDGVVEPVTRWVSGTVTVLRGSRRLAPRVRPRFVVAGAVGAVALLAAIALVSAPPGAADGAAPGVATDPSADSGPGVDAERGDDAELGDSGGGTLSSDAPETVPHPAPDEWQGMIAALVGRWVDCRASVASENPVANAGNAADECGRQVVHGGSAAERLMLVADDRHAILGRWLTLRGNAVVIEQMGGAVLVDLVAGGTTTASLLVVRSEAGWRIRDVIGETAEAPRFPGLRRSRLLRVGP